MKQEVSTGRAKHSTILIVEDEVRAQRLLRINLEPLGYRVLTADQAAKALEIVEQQQPDLIVLDLDLSKTDATGADGFVVCKQVRERSSVPIIVLSAFTQTQTKVRALQAGADDYVTKPYDPAELSARIDAVLRRTNNRPLQQQPLFVCGPLTIDFDQRRVTIDGKEVSLSRTEYRLLEYLAQNAGRTLVADAVIANVWGPEYMGDYASLHLYISRLRRKLMNMNVWCRPILACCICISAAYGANSAKIPSIHG